jgi:hypothetical protein
MWRLVVTELGGSAPLSDVSVEAANWMAAVKAGRSAIGEEGGVPTGASCAVAPDGKVTIHDPVARKTYLLTSSGRATSEAPPPVVAPQASVPAVAPQPKLSKKTIAYNIHEHAPVVAAQQAVPPQAVPQQAVPPQAVQPQAAPPPVVAAPVAVPSPAHVAAPASAPSASPPEKRPLSKQTIAYNVNEQGPIVPPQKEAAVGALGIVTPPATPIEPQLELMAERGEDPTEKSPLHYREKIFVAPPNTPVEIVEDLVRARFGMLRAELDDKPPGKFFNLAVFDHRWEGRPNGPPLVTLQWKDWRGDPVITFPAKHLRERGALPQMTTPPPGTQPSAAPAASTPAAAILAAPSMPVAPPITTSAPSAPPAEALGFPAPLPAPIAAPAPAPAAAEPGLHQKRTRTDEQDVRLAKAFEASQDLFFLSTPVEGLEFAMRLLSELVPCEAASACLYDINTDEFRFVRLSGPGAEARQGEAVPNNMGLMGVAALRAGEVLIVDNATADARFDPGVDGRVGLEPKSFLYIPLNHQGQLFGVVQLINRVNRPGFTTADGDVSSYVGKQLGEFLQKARMSVDELRRHSG